jgi:hypothetical protein
MLSKILFTGHQTKKIAFDGDKAPAGKGFLEIGMSLPESSSLIELLSSDADENGFCRLTYPMVAEYHGYGESKDEETFSLKTDITLYFFIHNSINFSVEFIDENFWFFENFASLAAKESAEKILSLTRFRKVEVPANRVIQSK